MLVSPSIVLLNTPESLAFPSRARGLRRFHARLIGMQTDRLNRSDRRRRSSRQDSWRSYNSTASCQISASGSYSTARNESTAASGSYRTRSDLTDPRRPYRTGGSDEYDREIAQLSACLSDAIDDSKPHTIIQLGNHVDQNRISHLESLLLSRMRWSNGFDRTRPTSGLVDSRENIKITADNFLKWCRLRERDDLRSKLQTNVWNQVIKIGWSPSLHRPPASETIPAG